MKTLPTLLLTLALAAATANAASAYSFSPPDTRARLTGNLTFTPDEGGHPFTCRATLILKTKNNDITSIAMNANDSAACRATSFQFLPWLVTITGANSGTISNVGFVSGDGNCTQFAVQFQDNPSGTWTLPAGQCFSGTLTSHPAVTITP